MGLTQGGAGPLAVVAPLAAQLSLPGGPLSNPAAVQALSLIGLPPELFHGKSEAMLGFAQPRPVLDALSAFAAAVAVPVAQVQAPMPTSAGRLRVVQKA